MLPTYRDGDRLLVQYGARAQPGRAFLVRLPPSATGPRPLAVKRIERAEDDGWWVSSDNPDEGTDSRTFGAVADADVIAKVLLRIPTGSRRPGRRTE